MIFGNYPCCEGNLSIVEPDRMPTYAPEDCPHCGARVWHLFDSYNSCTWVEEAFLTEYEVDLETRKIKPKNPPAVLTEDQQKVRDIISEIVVQQMVKEIMGPDVDLPLKPRYK